VVSTGHKVVIFLKDATLRARAALSSERLSHGAQDKAQEKESWSSMQKP